MTELTLPPWLLERVQAADGLALEARAVALAGDQVKAAELRAAFDALYDALEVELFGQPTAIFLAENLLDSQPATVQHGAR